MISKAWTAALRQCADAERAGQFLKQLASTSAGKRLAVASVEEARVLAALLAGSQAAGALLAAHPDWLAVLDATALAAPRRAAGLRKELAAATRPLLAHSAAAALAEVRRFKQREMLRIAARDLAGLAPLTELLEEISDVADVCLGAVYQVVSAQFATKHGLPHHQDADGHWLPTEFCVLGLGKLGGRELNYSSDVDLLFVYSDEGEVFRELPGARKGPRPALTNHQFFARLAEAFIAEVTRLTDDGALYRIDLRLRPEGDAGPLVRSLPSYENYYAQWGQTWERMMLLKARCVAGDPELAAEFLDLVNPFRYPRTLGEGVLREVAAVKQRIETEVVKSDELDRNVKLGRGGIREIEFVAQTLQLIHGGRNPFLQNPQTLPALEKLAKYNLLKAEDATALAAAYRFLRSVEHRLQMEDNRQTHVLPASRPALERLARLMGCKSLKEFEAHRRAHTGRVRAVYEALLRPDQPEPAAALPGDFSAAAEAWRQLLKRLCFRDVERALRVIREFVEGPGFVHVSPRTVELGRQLLSRLFALCRQDGGQPQGERLPPRTLSDPDRVVTRLDSFIAAYGARATLFEIWNANPTLFELLVLLFDRSEFLAEAAIRAPEVVDELVTSGRLRRRKTAADILRDLLHGLDDPDQHLWLRRYFHTEQMRIGLRDILELADAEQNLAEYSALADACLQYALAAVLRRRRVKQPPFVILGLGKLGGAEINYGSDLDVIFVAPPGGKALPKLHRLAAEVMDLLSARTEAGTVFVTDARLRPDGEKGLLVNTLDAFEDYYRQRAALWEIQALTRVRPIAGDLELGAQFQALAGALSDFSPTNVAADFPGRTGLLPVLDGAGVPSASAGVSPANASPLGRDALEAGATPAPLPRSRSRKETPPCLRTGLAAYSPDWRQKIHAMRLRIEKERTPAGKDALAIKTGTGGLMDAEFIAQALCLAHGWQEAHTLRALERGRDAGVLPNAAKLLDAYRELRRLEGILRRWSYEGETVLPDDPAPYYRVAVRCGFASPEAFRAALAAWRQAVREVHWQVFAGG